MLYDDILQLLMTLITDIHNINIVIYDIVT